MNVGYEFNPNFISLKSKLMIAMICLVCGFEAMCFSVYLSYLPQSAMAKEMDISQVGLIIGAFPLSNLLFGFIFDFLLPFLDTRFMFLSSFFIQIGTMIPFAFIMEAKSGLPFFISASLCRFFQGIGDVGIMVSAYAMIAGEFPNHLTFLIGVIEMCSGLGTAIAPVIGGFVYDQIGFKAPFFIISCASVVIFIASYFLVKPEYTYTENILNSHSWLLCLQKPELILCFLCSASAYMDVSYMDLSLAPRVTEYLQESYTTAGLMFGVLYTVYGIGSPIIGFINDSTKKYIHTILIGILFSILGYLLIGPVPFLRIESSMLWLVVSMIIVGLSAAFVFIPAAGFLRKSLVYHRFIIDSGINKIITNTLVLGSNFGKLCGPLFGGLLLNDVGYAKTGIAFSAKSLVLGALLISYIVYRYYTTSRKKRNQQPLLAPLL